MTIAVGASAKGRTSSGTSQTTSSVTTQASGSSFVVAVMYDPSRTVAVSDSKSNSPYTQIGSTRTFNGAQLSWYLCTNGTGGASHTWTATISGGASTCTIFAFEITGGATSSLLDQQNGVSDDNSSPFDSPSITTTQANELWVSVLAVDSPSNPSSHTAGNGYSILTNCEETDGSNFFTGCVATQVVSATGTTNSTFTAGGAIATAVVIGSFKELVTTVVQGKSIGVQGPGVQPRGLNQFRPGPRALSNDVVVFLAGQSAAFSAGTLTPSTSVPLTGASATFAAGSMVPDIQVSLTGQGATFAAGVLTVAGQGGLGAIPLPGPGVRPFNSLQFTRSLRSTAIATNVTVSLTGQAATFSAGTITPAPSVVLAGQSASFSTGTLAVSISVPLTGLRATFSSGTVTPVTGVVVALTGSAATFGAGVLGPVMTVALTGKQVTFTAGTVRIGGGNMPSLIGLNYYEAQDALQAVGIYIPIPPYAFQPQQITVRWEKSTQYLGGIVIAQNPQAGENVDPGDPITLTVSNFPFGSLIE